MRDRERERRKKREGERQRNKTKTAAPHFFHPPIIPRSSSFGDSFCAKTTSKSNKNTKTKVGRERKRERRSRRSASDDKNQTKTTFFLSFWNKRFTLQVFFSQRKTETKPKRLLCLEHGPDQRVRLRDEEDGPPVWSRSKTRSRLREERKEPSSLLSFSLCFSSVHILFLFISSFSHHPAAEHGSAAEDMVHAVWCIKRERERERKRGGKTNGECLMFYIVVPVSSFLSFYPSLTPGATAATGT